MFFWGPWHVHIHNDNIINVRYNANWASTMVIFVMFLSCFYFLQRCDIDYFWTFPTIAIGAIIFSSHRDQNTKKKKQNGSNRARPTLISLCHDSYFKVEYQNQMKMKLREQRQNYVTRYFWHMRTEIQMFTNTFEKYFSPARLIIRLLFRCVLMLYLSNKSNTEAKCCL